VAVALGCASAALFGAMTVALRMALRRSAQVELGTVVTVAVAAAVALAATAIDAAIQGSLELGSLWPFALAGLIAPGGSQILFTLAVRDAGASRASVVVGTAPLASVAIAIGLLGEAARTLLVLGAVLIVVGGIALASERGRPEHVRLVGLVFAFAATWLFASRDNLVRWLAGRTDSRPAAAAAATLLTGLLVAVALLRARRSHSRRGGGWPFVLPGLLFGLSYVSLFEAYFRGRVTVVSPLVATESLWGVLLSILALRRSELVGRRLLLGAVLIVAGGALIGAYR
jgi:drug/metabolite transporter (DMT)-like permease